MKTAIQPIDHHGSDIAVWENEGGSCLPDFIADAARDTGHDTDHILPRLGLSVVAHWKHLPRRVQKMIFEDLDLTINPAEARDLKEKVARFLHDKSHASRPAYQGQPWPLGTMTF